jgi:hypothetical protein
LKDLKIKDKAAFLEVIKEVQDEEVKSPKKESKKGKKAGKDSSAQKKKV